MAKPPVPYRCPPHKTGVGPGRPPFFDPACHACQQKLAAGAVTGNEPLPKANYRAQVRRGLNALAHETIANRLGAAGVRAHRADYEKEARKRG